MENNIFFYAKASLVFLLFISQVNTVFSNDKKSQLPNIIYVFADDLGYRELGCYGQKHIKTPHIDRIAKEGIKFTQHYSGNPVSAPSRCVLMTGKHNGHSYFRNNSKKINLPEETFTLAGMLQNKGYKTACIGKWGLGLENTSGHPNKQGFDFFYGYLNQSRAHQYYPTYLWKNNQKDSLNNQFFRAHQHFPLDKDPFNPADYEQYQGKEYSIDKMGEEALA